MSRAQVRSPHLALALLLLTITASGDLVKWRPNTSFNLPLNFDDNKLPCKQQSVLFPEKLVSSVRINGVNNLKSLVLPLYGQLDLSDGAAVYFGSDVHGDDKSIEECPARDIYYMERSTLAWLQADAWDAEKFNAATPDAQRVPCFDDDVLFPQDSQFSIQLPEETQNVRSINIGGVEVGQSQFRYLADSSFERNQAFTLNKALSVGVQVGAKPCQSRAGCPCQNNAPVVDCSLKSCDVPKCTNPVKPEGNCCPICGGVLVFETNINTFDFMSFKKVVEKFVDDFGGPSKIVHHIGLLTKGKIQVVMIDREEYEGTSSLALNEFDRSLGIDVVHGMKQRLISGAPLGRVGAGWEVVGLALFVALLVFGGVYVWFQKPEVVLAIPLPRLPAQAPAVFSRFNNRENSLTSLTSRASVAFGASFRNPLYDSKRGKSGNSESDAAPAPAAPARAAETSPAQAARNVVAVTRMSYLISHDD